MTDADLRDAAWAELQQTTVGYDRASRYSPSQWGKTHWGKAKALLDQIGQTTPPSEPPLMDMRATTVTALPASGRQGSETPADAFDVLTYQGGDISLVDDPRFGRVFKVHMHQGPDFASSSHNPWGGPSDPWHQIPNSGELIRHRTITAGETVWYAGSVKLLSPAGLISRANGWGICAQLGYTGVSPPVAVALEAEGIGLDLDGGVFDTARWTGQNHLRANYVPVADAVGKWCDFIITVKWAMNTTGFVVFGTRLDGGEWKQQYGLRNVPTAQAVNCVIDEKQGGYFGLFGKPNPVGWEITYLLRGLSLHGSLDDAIGALA